jgi:hypothetical protein
MLISRRMVMLVAVTAITAGYAQHPLLGVG